MVFSAATYFSCIILQLTIYEKYHQLIKPRKYYSKHRIVIPDRTMREKDADLDFDNPDKIFNRGGKLKGKGGVLDLLKKYGDPNFSL